jgi:hypothetical protein
VRRLKGIQPVRRAPEFLKMELGPEIPAVRPKKSRERTRREKERSLDRRRATRPDLGPAMTDRPVRAELDYMAMKLRSREQNLLPKEWGVPLQNQPINRPKSRTELLPPQRKIRGQRSF